MSDQIDASAKAATTPAQATLALSTKVEEDFVSPLTAIRGALEILRDFPNLTPPERARFVDGALTECRHLERGVAHLAETVYAAGARSPEERAEADAAAEKYLARIAKLEELGILDIDFSDFEFSSAALVNEFYDVIDKTVLDSRKHWYFMANHLNLRVWPEAWVAFAHRGKKVSVSFSLGTARYVEGGALEDRARQVRQDPTLLPSREAALAHIEELKSVSRR